MKKAIFVATLLSKIIGRYFLRLGNMAIILPNGKKRIFRPTTLNFTYSRTFLLIFLVSLAALFFWQVGSRRNQLYISEGIVGVYNQGNLPVNVTALISEPLVTLDNSGTPQANLVKGWELNENGTIYTFKLKDNLYWNDGSKVISSEIKYSFPDVEVSYPDESTITFKLADTFTPFPTLLTEPIMKSDSLVGVGKYRIVREEYSREIYTKLILEPTDKTQQALPAVIIRFYPDESTAITAFKLGEISAIVGLTRSDELLTYPTVNWQPILSYSKILAVFYNTQDNFLKDKNLRKALTAATPIFGGEIRAKGPLPPTSWAFSDPAKDIYNDPEMAQSYLDKVEDVKGKEVILTTTPNFQGIGEKIVQAWNKLGLKTSLKVESGTPQNFQALLIAQPIPPDPDQYTLWHSTQTKTNISKYSWPRVDKDLEDGRKIKDQRIRQEKYADFQKVILDDAPATFLYFPKTSVVYRQKIEDELNKVLYLQVQG